MNAHTHAALQAARELNIGIKRGMDLHLDVPCFVFAKRGYWGPARHKRKLQACGFAVNLWFDF